MPQILLRVDETEYKQLQEKSIEFGLSKAAFIRQIMREYFRKPVKEEQPANDLKKEIRAIIPVLAQAFGRTHNASPEATEGLSKVLLKIYDQEVLK